MSLYTFGKLICLARCRQDIRVVVDELSRRLGVALRWGDLDSEDRAFLEAQAYLEPEGLCFGLSSNSNSVDATELWIEAMDRGREVLCSVGVEPAEITAATLGTIDFPASYWGQVLGTKIGTLCRGLMTMPDCHGGGIALVDGGIDKVFVAAKEDCLRELLRSFVVPWDCSPNTLYIWDKRRDAGQNG